MTQDSPLKPRHAKFCLLYILGKSAQEAYQEAFPDASPESAKVSAHRLLTQDNVNQEISRLQQENHEEIKKREKKFESKVDHEFIESARLALLKDDNTPANVRQTLLRDLEATLPDAVDTGKLVIQWGD